MLHLITARAALIHSAQTMDTMFLFLPPSNLEPGDEATPIPTWEILMKVFVFNVVLALWLQLPNSQLPNSVTCTE